MTQFTKKAIIETFVELLNEKPFDKITVTDVVSRCGINRNTFYYHYQDLYALVDEMFKLEADLLAQEHPDYTDLKAGFVKATQFARENKAAIYHLYHSQNRERLEQYLYDVTHPLVEGFLRQHAQGMDVSEKDLGNLSMVYTAALKGVATQWVDENMPTDTEERIDDVGRLLSGITGFVLNNAQNR